jgi:hypothetical protein
MQHLAAVRTLAFKWIRVLYRCWVDRVPRDEARYLRWRSRSARHRSSRSLLRSRADLELL